MNDDKLFNLKEERVVVSFLINNGKDAYHELINIINEDCFGKNIHKVLYKCIHKIYEKREGNVDFLTIEAVADSLGFTNYFDDSNNFNYLESLKDEKVSLENALISAKKIRKLGVARDLHTRHSQASKKYLEITGDESIEEILAISEDVIYNSNIVVGEEESHQVFEGLPDYFKRLKENKDGFGISTGYTRYDYAIGGGLTAGNIDVIAARMKIGKSFFAVNLGINVARLGIPVLHVDSEMSQEMFQIRLASVHSGVNTYKIRSGKFGEDETDHQKLLDSYYKIKDLPYRFRSVVGLNIEEWINVMRSFVIKRVGLNQNGLAKKCLIILDWFQITDENQLKNISEWQALGFGMRKIHAFAHKHQVSIVLFVQQNREALTGETTGTIAGSDRIAQLCSSLSILKKKDSEEIAKDGAIGTHKLLPLITRHGPGLSADNEYINMVFNQGKFTEHLTNFELETQRQMMGTQEPTEENPEEVIEF